MTIKQFIFLGPLGVKVQQHAIELAQLWHVSHVSMSTLVQEAIANKTAIGVEASPYVEAEALVPDPLMLKLLRRRLEQPDTMLNGWIVEGFPCTLAQAKEFNEWWSKLGQPQVVVVYLKALTGILMNRLATEPGQTESTPAIRRRLERYQAEVEPVLDYYQQHNCLKIINASLPFAEVARDLAQLGQDQAGAAPWIHDEAELDTLIASQSRLVVDCMASWCGSCKQVTASIDKLAEEYRDRVMVMKIDFDANQKVSKQFSLKGIPSVMFFKNGRLLQTLTGVKSYTEYNTAVTNLLD
jgi:thioredoxin